MDLLIADAASVRSLSRIFHTAAKLSDHLQFTPHASALHLRLLNGSQSTFANFRLYAPFFTSHNFPLAAPLPPHKVPARALLPLLRSPTATHSLRIRSAPASLHLRIRSRTGVQKDFRVPITEGRVSTVSALPSPHSLRSTSRLFLDILHNFHVKLDEITFVPSDSALKLTSYVDDDPSHAILRTEMTISSDELEHFQFPPQQHSFTIPCRALRTALEFCEPYDSLFTLSFTEAGQPVLLTQEIRNMDNPVFDVRFIFSSRQPHLPSSAPNSSTKLPAHSSPRHQIQNTTSTFSHPPANFNQSLTSPHQQTPQSFRQQLLNRSLPKSTKHTPLKKIEQSNPSGQSEYVSPSNPSHSPLSYGYPPQAPPQPLHNYNPPNVNQKETDSDVDGDEDEYVEATPPP